MATPNVVPGTRGGSWAALHVATLETGDAFGWEKRDLQILDLEKISVVSLSSGQPSTSSNLAAGSALCPHDLSELTFSSGALRTPEHRSMGRKQEGSLPSHSLWSWETEVVPSLCLSYPRAPGNVLCH